MITQSDEERSVVLSEHVSESREVDAHRETDLALHNRVGSMLAPEQILSFGKVNSGVIVGIESREANWKL